MYCLCPTSRIRISPGILGAKRTSPAPFSASTYCWKKVSSFKNFLARDFMIPPRLLPLRLKSPSMATMALDSAKTFSPFSKLTQSKGSMLPVISKRILCSYVLSITELNARALLLTLPIPLFGDGGQLRPKYPPERLWLHETSCDHHRAQPQSCCPFRP